jgi:hypothetical protein
MIRSGARTRLRLARGVVVLDADAYLVGSACADDGNFVDGVAGAIAVGDVGVDVEVGGVAVLRERVDMGEGSTVASPIRRAEYYQQRGRRQTGCRQEPHGCSSPRCSCHVGLPS